MLLLVDWAERKACRVRRYGLLGQEPIQGTQQNEHSQRIHSDRLAVPPHTARAVIRAVGRLCLHTRYVCGRSLDFACGSIWVLNMVSDSKRGT
jgi:hypothetical protein